MGPDVEASVRRRRWLVTALVLVAVVSPVLRDRDSFPLSTYPMYATTRAEVASFSTAVGYDDGGERVLLSLATIARADDALIAETRVEQAIAADRAGELCAEVAGRVGDDIVRIEVVTERHELVDLATGQESLVDREVHASCEVEG